MKTLSHVIFIEAAQKACSPKHLADCGAFDDYSSQKDFSWSHISVGPDLPDHPWVSAGLH